MYKVSGKELLAWIQNVSSEDGDKEALYLLLDLLGDLSKEDLNLLKIDSSKEISIKENINTIESCWLDYLIENKPIQYICGKAYWRNFKLKVSKDVLIPRKETEIIIDIVMDICTDKKHVLFADLGTGSGAIAIALAVLNHNWNGLATDISNKVLDISKENFESYKKASNLKFYCGNWWKPLEKYAGDIEIAISNPPYIPQKVYDEISKSVKKYEPEIALNGGWDGLSHIKQIIKTAPMFLKKGGWLILENHFDQAKKVVNIMRENGFESIDIINDYSGIGRFTIGRYK